jgi:hypothetical protein
MQGIYVFMKMIEALDQKMPRQNPLLKNAPNTAFSGRVGVYRRHRACTGNRQSQP